MSGPRMRIRRQVPVHGQTQKESTHRMENLGNTLPRGSRKEEEKGQPQKTDRLQAQERRMQNLPKSLPTLRKN